MIGDARCYIHPEMILFMFKPSLLSPNLLWAVIKVSSSCGHVVINLSKSAPSKLNISNFGIFISQRLRRFKSSSPS